MEYNRLIVLLRCDSRTYMLDNGKSNNELDDAVLADQTELDKNHDFVISIGDLNGNYTDFLNFFQGARVIDDNENWIAGNAHVIVHGDILADRSTDGFKILLKIGKLRQQAKANGGYITVLAGNHDREALRLLGLESSVDPTIDSIHAVGLSEFNKYGYHADSKRTKEESNKILTCMQTNQTGKEVLEEMAKMQLYAQVDNKLFIHTDLTNDMIDLLNLVKREIL